MKENGFTLIELLAVIVILAIIALIATPVVINIIKDTKEESNKRSIDMYASALKNALVKYQLDGTKLEISKLETTNGIDFKDTDFKVEYEGNVVCQTIKIYYDGNIYLANCEVNGEKVNYEYGEKQPESFATDDWETITKAVKNGKTSVYKVGDTKEITLTGEYSQKQTVRIANVSTPSECNNNEFSQTACGFVIEFVGAVSQYNMNPKSEEKPYGTNEGGWRDCAMRTYVNDVIYNSLPQDLKKYIIETEVISNHGTTTFTSNDKIYLLSTKEVYGESANTKEKTRQLDYYEQKGVTINNVTEAKKQINGSGTWWLRSAVPSFSRSFENVSGSGRLGNSYSYEKPWVSPAFRIGNKDRKNP